MSANAQVDPQRLHSEVESILRQHQDQLDEVTGKSVRYELEQRLGLARDELLPSKSAISAAIKACLPKIQGETGAGVKQETPEPGAPTSFSSLSESSPPSPPSAKKQAQLERNAGKKRQLAAAAGEDDEDEGDELEDRSVKKSKPSAPSDAASGSGDIRLAHNRRVEVRKFKGLSLIDIREVYVDRSSGEEKPGKKGIALKPSEWEALIKNKDRIDAAIQRLQ